MENHELANLFPMIVGEEFQKLTENIKQNGLLEPIWLYEGKILDGRNRYKACIQAGINPQYRNYEGFEPLKFVLSLNLHRRHLDESQRAMVAARIADMPRGVNQHVVITTPTQQDAAAMMNVSRDMVIKAKHIRENAAPEIIEAVERGELAVSKVFSQQKKQERKADIERQAEEIEKGNVPELSGVFDVLVFDPPWAYGREYDPEGSRVANPYPEMTQEQLLEMNIPAGDNAVMFLWTTHQFIFDAKELLDEWGFQYKATMVWNKEKIGMGAWLRMQCEFCLIGIRGKPYWENTTHRDIITEGRREHSRKPEAFYEMVEAITAGRKLDYFSRQKREGWEVFGNDTEKF